MKKEYVELYKTLNIDKDTEADYYSPEEFGRWLMRNVSKTENVTYSTSSESKKAEGIDSKITIV